MAAPIIRQITFCNLNSFQCMIGGIGSVRTSTVMKNYKKDLTPAQRYKNDPARIDEQPGPWKNFTDLNAWRRRPRTREPFDPNRLDKMLEGANFDTEDDKNAIDGSLYSVDQTILADCGHNGPVDIPNPYVQPPRRCMLCEHNIEITYKNPQLLSQFVSTYTGRIYGRHITGLCVHMQRRVASEIRLARRLGFMPSLYKKPKYFKDPSLFNPFQRKTYPPGE